MEGRRPYEVISFQYLRWWLTAGSIKTAIEVNHTERHIAGELRFYDFYV